MVTLIPHKINMQELDVTDAVQAPKSFSFLRKKSSGGARRALSALGPNNAKFNLNMAQSHIAMTQEGFTSRWNFNPLKEVPLPSGRYQWAPFNHGSDKVITLPTKEEVPVPKDITLLKDITNPTLTTCLPSSAATLEVKDLQKSIKDGMENSAIVVTSSTKHENNEIEDRSDTENRKQGLSPKSKSLQVSTNNVSSKSQICITEFFKPQKRKASYHCEGSPPNTPPKKKLRTVH